MTPRKLFTVAEANRLVPRLTLLVGRLQQRALELHAAMRDLAASLGVEDGSLSTGELMRRRPESRVLIEELDSIVHEIEDDGAELKDIQLGLVDFPSEREGEIVHLCWQFGEPEIAFWHPTSEGFAGRRPLPSPARTPSIQ